MAQKIQKNEMEQRLRAAHEKGRSDAHKLAASLRHKHRDPKRLHNEMLFEMAKAKAEADRLQAEFDMLKAHILVDAMSLADPTPLTTMVSLWMDYQEAGMRQ